MKYDRIEILKYWDSPNVESMYDKDLLRLEIDAISAHIPAGATVLDVGCGEGEGTSAYAGITGTSVTGVDFSATRLELAVSRLGNAPNVQFRPVDALDGLDSCGQFDVVVSQRFLINITDQVLQAKMLRNLVAAVRPRGVLCLLEGFQQGVDDLNGLRRLFGLSPIGVRWHNLFIDEDWLISQMQSLGMCLVSEQGFGAYFMLTRAVRPLLDTSLDPLSKFNGVVSAGGVESMMGLGSRFSRLKLWTFQKPVL